MGRGHPKWHLNRHPQHPPQESDVDNFLLHLTCEVPFWDGLVVSLHLEVMAPASVLLFSSYSVFLFCVREMILGRAGDLQFSKLLTLLQAPSRALGFLGGIWGMQLQGRASGGGSGVLIKERLYSSEHGVVFTVHGTSSS